MCRPAQRAAVATKSPRWRTRSSRGILTICSIPEMRVPGTSHRAPPGVAESSAGGDERWLPGQHIAVVVAAGLLVRLYLIHRYPVVFGGDAIFRLADTEHVVVLHQLPLLPGAVHPLTALVCPGGQTGSTGCCCTICRP